MLGIMSEEKKPEIDKIVLTSDTLIELGKLFERHRYLKNDTPARGKDWNEYLQYRQKNRDRVSLAFNGHGPQCGTYH